MTTETGLMDPKLLLHFFNCLIVRALDSGDTDRLRRLIVQRDSILDRLRLRDEPDDEAVAA